MAAEDAEVRPEAGAARWQSYANHRRQSFPCCNLLEATFGHVQSLDNVAASGGGGWEVLRGRMRR